MVVFVACLPYIPHNLWDFSFTFFVLHEVDVFPWWIFFVCLLMLLMRDLRRAFNVFLFSAFPFSVIVRPRRPLDIFPLKLCSLVVIDDPLFFSQFVFEGKGMEWQMEWHNFANGKKSTLMLSPFFLC